jgi:acyl carrier protein phosphodiesterase
MISHNWLKNYGTAEGLQFTFDRFSKRVTFEADFSNAAELLIQKVHELNEDFNAFFPELIEYVHKDFTEPLIKSKQ